MFDMNAEAETHQQDRLGRLLLVLSAVVLLGMAALVALEHYWLQNLKFDDAWIHLRYARNIAAGKGFVYNEGERILGSAGVLWNLLLAPLALVGSPSTLPAAVSVLNYLALLACVLIVSSILDGMVSRWLALVVAAILLGYGPLVVSSIGGMETVFLCLLHALVFFALTRRNFELAGLLAAVSCCFRIESFAIAGGVLLAVCLYRRDALFRTLGALLSILGVVFGWSWYYFGSPIANSTLAKKTAYVLPSWQALRDSLRALLAVFPFDQALPQRLEFPRLSLWFGSSIWLLLVLLGFLLVRQKSAPASLVVMQAILPPAFYAVTNPLMFPWYYCTFVPMATVFAILGMIELARRIRGIRLPLQYGLILALLGSISITPLREMWSPLVPPDSPRFSFRTPNARESSRTYQYANIARWLNTRSKPTDRVCISEIGTFGYYYHGKILDGLGLVSPEVLAYHPLPNSMRPGGAFGAIPPRVVRDFRPEFVVSLDLFAGALFSDSWFLENYQEIGRWNWFGGPVHWRDLPESLWGGTEVRAYRRRDLPGHQDGLVPSGTQAISGG